MSEFNQYFSTRALGAAVQEMLQPGRFLLDTFFSGVQVFPTKFIEIDSFTSSRNIAPFTVRDAQGQLLEKKGYSKRVWEPPYVKPKVVISPEDIQQAMIGEGIYGNPGGGVAKFVAERLAYLEETIQRREELMAMEGLFNNQVVLTDENGNSIGETITYTRASGLDVTVSTKWDNANSSPITDIEKQAILIGKNSGMVPDTVVLGSDAAENFMKNAKVQEILDRWNVNIGEMIYKYQQLGVTYLGNIAGKKYFRYDEWYTDPATGVVTALIPAKKALLGCSMTQNKRLYGAISDLNATYATQRYAKSWEENDPNVRFLQLHSAPLPAVLQPNAFAVLTVLS